jgi:thiol-disulfide isomerase/thioredoxin
MRIVSGRRAALAALLALAVASCGRSTVPAGGTRLCGRILTADGKPPLVAHVHPAALGEPADRTEITVAARADGSYEAVLPPGGGMVWFTAPDHRPAGVAVVPRPSDREVRLDVTLAPNRFISPIDKVGIIGDWNDFDIASAEPMTRQPDGTFLFERMVPGNTLAYQVVGVVDDGRSVNGTMQDEFVYDGGGDYRSVLHVRRGKARIVFDPARLLRRSDAGLPRVSPDAGHAYLATLFEIERRYDEESRRAFHEFVEHLKAHPGPGRYTPDTTAIRAHLCGLADDAAADPIVRQYAAIAMLRLLKYRFVERPGDEALAGRMVALVPPTSRLWRLSPSAITAGLPRSSPKRRERLWSLVKKNPDRTVQGFALAGLVGIAKENAARGDWRRLYDRLRSSYADVRGIDYELEMLDPDPPIQVGKTVPRFELPLLGGAGTVSSTSLRGRTYLLDFWATWCGPCVAQVPRLEEAYARFHPRGLEILSVSFDKGPDEVAKYRREKHRMPWLHALTERGFDSDIAREFSVWGIPRAVLIGPDGVILATGNELAGDRLDATLTRFCDRHDPA